MGRPPQTRAEFEILPGVVEASVRLHRAGFLLVVVTNQPDVARGTQRREVVEEFHRMLRAGLPVDDIRTCYHDDADRCTCRKPQPGLLTAAALDWEIDLASSFMIGDRWKDIEAGRRAGCRSFLVGGDAEANRCSPEARLTDLAGAADWILAISDTGASNDQPE